MYKMSLTKSFKQRVALLQIPMMVKKEKKVIVVNNMEFWYNAVACTVKRVNKNGFYFSRQGETFTNYMSFIMWNKLAGRRSPNDKPAIMTVKMQISDF